MLIYTCGCSFTHSTNSWAHCDDLYNLGIDNHPYLQAERFIEEKSHHRYSENFPGTAQEFDAIGKKIPGASYINLSSGGSSPAFQVLKFKNYVENNSVPDICIFQISGFTRKFLEIDLDLTDKNQGIVNQSEKIGTKWYLHFGNFMNIVDTYRNQIQNKEVRNYILPMVKEFTELSVNQVAKENFNSLIDLMLYCKNKKIKLGFIFGWDVISDQEGTIYSELIVHNNNQWEQVKELLITNVDIISYARKNLKEQDIYDIPSSTHPSALAHLIFWNDLIFPWLEKNINK